MIKDRLYMLSADLQAVYFYRHFANDKTAFYTEKQKVGGYINDRDTKKTL